MLSVVVGAGIVYGDLSLQHHLMVRDLKGNVPHLVCSHIAERERLCWKLAAYFEVDHRPTRVSKFAERISDQDGIDENQLRPAFVSWFVVYEPFVYESFLHEYFVCEPSASTR
jgi:hypothetical protein